MTEIFERKDLKVILTSNDGASIEITPMDASFSGLLNIALTSSPISETEVEIPVNSTREQLIFITEYLKDLSENKIISIRDTVKFPKREGKSLLEILGSNNAYDKYIQRRHYTNDTLCDFLAVANYFDIPSLISLLCAHFMVMTSTEINYIDAALNYNDDSSTSLERMDNLNNEIENLRADPVDEDKKGELKIVRGPSELFNSLFKSDEEKEEKKESKDEKTNDISLRSQYLSSEMKDISYVIFKDGYFVASRYYFNSDKSLYGYAESVKTLVNSVEEQVKILIDKRFHNFSFVSLNDNTVIGYDFENEMSGGATSRSDFVHPQTGKLVGRTINDVSLMYRYQDPRQFKIPATIPNRDKLSYRQKRIISKLMECASFPVDLIPYCLKYDNPVLPRYNLAVSHICQGPIGESGTSFIDSNIVVNKYVVQNGYDVTDRYRIIATEITGQNNQIELIPYINEQKTPDNSKEKMDADFRRDYNDINFQIDDRYYICVRQDISFNRRVYVWDMKELESFTGPIKYSNYDFSVERDEDGEESILFADGSNGIIIAEFSYHNGTLAYTIKGERIYIPETHFDDFSKVTSKYWLARDVRNNAKYLVDISSIGLKNNPLRIYRIPNVQYSSDITVINETTLQFFALNDATLSINTQSRERSASVPSRSSEEKKSDQKDGFYVYTFANGGLSKAANPFFPADAIISSPYERSGHNKYLVYFNTNKNATGNNTYIENINDGTFVLMRIPLKKYTITYINDNLVAFINSGEDSLKILNLSSGTINDLILTDLKDEFDHQKIEFAGGLSDGTLFIRSSSAGSYTILPNGDTTKIEPKFLHNVKEIQSLNRIIMMSGTDYDDPNKCFTEIWS